jgi:hypothetical protein
VFVMVGSPDVVEGNYESTKTRRHEDTKKAKVSGARLYEVAQGFSPAITFFVFVVAPLSLVLYARAYCVFPPICTSKPSGSWTWKLPSVVRIFNPRRFSSASTFGLTDLSVSQLASVYAT